MSTEAFINELQQLATDAAVYNSAEPGWVKLLAEVLEEAEGARVSVEFKYHIAKLVLSGEAFDRGSQPFQDFALLVSLRNRVVHAKPEKAVRQKEADGALNWETKIMGRLQSRGVFPPDDIPPRFVPAGQPVKIQSNLLAEIGTQPVARWACGAAAGIVNAVLDAVPTSPRLSSLVQRIYRKDFRNL